MIWRLMGCLGLLAIGCNETRKPAPDQPNDARVRPTANAPPGEPVSLIRLIAAPDQFDGLYVGVMGYCWIEQEADALYVHEDDQRHGFTLNSVDLGFEHSQTSAGACGDRNVFVLGKFSSRGSDLRSGAIDVDRVLMLPGQRNGPADPP